MINDGWKDDGIRMFFSNVLYLWRGDLREFHHNFTIKKTSIDRFTFFLKSIMLMVLLMFEILLLLP